MDLIIYPSRLHGSINAIPSKSQAHRLLICAAFADKATKIHCSQTNKDIEATAGCLNALGANVVRGTDGYLVTPAKKRPKEAHLYCGESGSTLRFLLPVVGALGITTTFHLEGRLSQRPLSPLWEEMERMGCSLSRPTQSTVLCTGKLVAGTYSITGNISSQYISGLLFAAALIQGECKIEITSKLESAPYVEMTKNALSTFGVSTKNNTVAGSQTLRSPESLCVEGDWSNAAFFMTAQHLGHSVDILGLNDHSVQGDRVVKQLLSQLTRNITVNAADIPDLVPILAVFAACNHGATFENISRLRLKESDRVSTIASMLHNLGAKAQISENTFVIYPAAFHGCTIDAANDHRIAMAAAIAALKASAPVVILGAQCVEKSYPTFWSEYRQLGGKYEQYVR